MTFVADTANDLFVEVLDYVCSSGDHVAPRGFETREIRGASLLLTDPACNLVTVKSLNVRFAVAEFLWILTGQNRLDLIDKFNGEIARYSDDGRHLSGAYGPPVADQLPWVIKQLEDQEDTRQALLTIWRPRPGPSADVPCTISMQFMLRDGALEMVVFMRSNDLWLGFPYDLFVFTMIQRYVAHAVGVPAGPYHHHVGSLHVYERNLDAVLTALDTPHSHVGTADLALTYPWPLVALEVLIAAPEELLEMSANKGAEMSPGWWNLLGLLIPAYSSQSERWREILDTHGLEPRGFKEYL